MYNVHYFVIVIRNIYSAIRLSDKKFKKW